MNSDFFNNFKTIKQYGWSSMFFTYLKYLVLVIMIPLMVLSSVIYIYFSSMITNDINDRIEQSLSKTQNTIESVFSEIDRCNRIFSSNLQVSSFLLKKDIQSDHMTNTVNTSRIGEIMRNLINTTEYLDSIHIYSKKNNYVFSSQNSNYINLFHDTDWYDFYLETNNPNFLIQSQVDYNNYKYNIISYCYGLYNNTTLMGILVINIDSDKLQNMLFPDISEQSEIETIYLSDKSNHIIYTNNKELNFEKIDDVYNSHNFKNSTILEKELENYPVKLTISMPMGNINKKLNTTKIIIILGASVLALLAVLLSSLIAMKFYRSISQAITMIEMPIQFQNSNGSNYKGKNELLYLSDNIVSTIKNSKNIEQDLVKKIVMLKKAQSIALQTQINPHFLFNTLNIISGAILSITKEDNYVVRMVSLLSDIIYNSLNTKEFIISVTEEIENAKKYVEIELIKSKNGFDIDWNIENGVENYKVVKVILQPILENALDHGIKKLKNKRGRIIVNICIKDNCLLFEIIDNGIGISQDELIEISKMINKQDLQESKHIGLYNVHQRVRLIYGEQYGCNINSNENGTKVSIKVPTF